MSPADYEQPVNQIPCDHQMAPVFYRQRRIHSVSHIEYPQNTGSPSFSRALSSSPTRTSPTQVSPFAGANYSYQHSYSAPPHGQSSKLTTFGHVESLKERLTGKTSSHPPKTSSQTSLLSSSSEQSMDCNLLIMPLKSDIVATRSQDDGGDGGGSNSNMSVGSDTTPALVTTEEKPNKSVKAKVCIFFFRYQLSPLCAITHYFQYLV